MRRKSTAQAIKQLDRLVTRATKETRSKEDALARIVIAKARSLLSVRGKQYFDRRRVQTLMSGNPYSHGMPLRVSFLLKNNLADQFVLNVESWDIVLLTVTPGLPPAMGHLRKMNALPFRVLHVDSQVPKAQTAPTRQTPS